MPNPELREFDFNPVDWIKRNRSAYLSALGVLIRSWVVKGKVLGSSPGSDSYAVWRRVVDGILEAAGIAGGFDPQENRVQLGASDAEWGVFLEAAFDILGDRTWRMSELVEVIGKDAPGGIDLEILPGQLAAKYDPWKTGGFTKSLGRWAMHRDGKWVGNVGIFGAGVDGHTRSRLWRIAKRV
jgi:hypothetical protein